MKSSLLQAYTANSIITVVLVCATLCNRGCRRRLVLGACPNVVLFRVYVTACMKGSSTNYQERRVNVAQVLRQRFRIHILFPELLYRMVWILYVCASLLVGEVVGGR